MEFENARVFPMVPTTVPTTVPTRFLHGSFGSFGSCKNPRISLSRPRPDPTRGAGAGARAGALLVNFTLSLAIKTGRVAADIFVDIVHCCRYYLVLCREIQHGRNLVR